MTKPAGATRPDQAGIEARLRARVAELKAQLEQVTRRNAALQKQIVEGARFEVALRGAIGELDALLTPPAAHTGVSEPAGVAPQTPVSLPDPVIPSEAFQPSPGPETGRNAAPHKHSGEVANC